MVTSSHWSTQAVSGKAGHLKRAGETLGTKKVSGKSAHFNNRNAGSNYTDYLYMLKNSQIVFL